MPKPSEGTLNPDQRPLTPEHVFTFSLRVFLALCQALLSELIYHHVALGLARYNTLLRRRERALGWRSITSGTGLKRQLERLLHS